MRFFRTDHQPELTPASHLHLDVVAVPGTVHPRNFATFRSNVSTEMFVGFQHSPASTIWKLTGGPGTASLSTSCSLSSASSITTAQ